MGLFILTGSQQFNLNAKISQTLAGRVGIVQLLPFSLAEIQAAQLGYAKVEDLIFHGLYPPIYDRKVPPSSWYSDYIMTYLERDVRQLLQVQNLNTFRRFVQMCAARTGQLLNLSSLANDCGITHNTAKAWISTLEASYILFLLPPHFQNFGKRLTKSPKLYFYDTGLVCALLNIQSSQPLNTHAMRGALFETWVVSELIKHRFNQGLHSNLYFWRDSQGHEVNVLIDRGEHLVPIEIKAGQTISSNYFDGLSYWQKLNANAEQQKAYLIYAGESSHDRSQAGVIAWQNMGALLDKMDEG